jgi:signal transduction histidine kinase/putative methionine-R-sulfoxide reductase with GAF domain
VPIGARRDNFGEALLVVASRQSEAALTTGPGAAEAGVPMNVPSEKLLALLETSNTMMQHIFLEDDRAMLQTVTRRICSLLEAESCGIFLVRDDVPDELVLEGSYSDKLADEVPPVRVRIRSAPNSGLTGHIAHQGEVVRLHGRDCRENQYIAGNVPEHLMSLRNFSLLGVPLKDRKGRVWGVLKVDNKKNSEGEPDEALFFTEVDESLAVILANQMVIALANTRTPRLLARLAKELRATQDLSEALKSILHTTVACLRADRAGIALWNEAKGDLVIAAYSGDSVLNVGQAVPVPSLTQALWKSGQPSRLVSDVSKEADYYPANRQTQSEIAIRLELNMFPLGVLNVESFQLNAFDDRDLEVLQVLAQHAAVAIPVIDREMSFRGIVQRLVERPPAYDDILKSILTSVREIYQLDGGIIYIADEANRVLRCSAYISDKSLAITNPGEFSYRFNEPAFATEVFRTQRTHFSMAPSDDPIVNKRGLQAFQIDSAMIGLPLTFDDKVVGVLVAWSDRYRLDDAGRHTTELQRFGRLAAANIAFSASEQQRTNVLQAVQHILSEMQSELSREKNLRVILDAIRIVGFDRAFVFQAGENGQKFFCADSVGTENPERFRGYTTSSIADPYINDLTETALANPKARRYEPVQFGLPPDCEGLERPPDLPWVLAPLVITGKLYGYIAADNAETRREISDVTLGYVTLLGGLAAQAIANSVVIEMLGTRDLPIFAPRPNVEASEFGVLRRLLVYLTAGEAFGFSRALYLKVDDRSRSLVYAAGLGSITADRHEVVARKAQGEGVGRLIDRAEEFHDPDLEAAMKDFRVECSEAPLPQWLENVSAQQLASLPVRSRPGWILDLVDRIRAADFLAAPVRTQAKVFGLFIVDRQWQTRALDEADKSALATFTRLAAANIAIFESGMQRATILEAIGRILTNMQTELSREKNLRLILRGVQEVGFDRVRVFRFDADTKSFVCLDSLGAAEAEEAGKYAGHTILLARSQYATDTVKTALNNPRARKYDPIKFGPSPDAEALGRDPDLPWAVAPLVISGTLYGQITADNTPTRREITDESLEYMTFLGALAAQTIANAETIEALRASRLKDEFLQRMAHIFGSTTAGVAILVANIKDEIVDNERIVREYIPQIAKLNERFSGLAQTIIDFAALREDTKLNIAAADLAALAEDAIERLRVPAEDKGVRFDVVAPQRPYVLDVDPVRAGTAIEALIDNAIKFSPAHGRIYVVLETNGEVELRIRDEGTGIPAEDLRLVFDSFYRGRNARERHVDGTGLGLSIVDQTMRLHGGTATVQNHPHGGAEFTLSFPKTPRTPRT